MKRNTSHWAWLSVAMLCTISTVHAQIPTSGLVLRLTGEIGVEKLVGPAGNGDPVVRWLDQSGLGNNVSTNGNPDSQTPTYLTGVVNGRAVVDYDNINDRLQATTPLLTGSTDFSIFAVIRPGPAGERVIGGNFGINNLSGLYLIVNGNSNLALYNGGFLTGSTTMSDTSWYLVQAEKSGSAYTLRLNDVTEGTGSLAGSIGGSRDWTVGNASDYQASLRGDMAQQLVYNRALTAEERNFVVRRFADDYNLAIVPEPSAVALLGLSGLLMLRCRR